MRAFFNGWIVRALALLLAATAASAQERVPFRQEELDQMLAPVALYPDSLLSQMLMASTYPLEVVQAARWSRANPGLSGQEAVRAVEPMDWDPSVKSLTAFPRVLAMMNERLEWTERLGEAFLAQQADVMDTIQGLRRRAEAAGNLESNEQMRVARQGEVILIDPPAPGVVFVPYYDPLVVYGPWWWPLYPPVYWAPPPHYVVVAHRPAFAWGSGIVLSAGFFFGHFDWPHRHVKVVHVHHHRPDARPARVHAHWRHDPAHRRGVPFRHAGARPQIVQARPERSFTDRTTENRQRRWDERARGTPGRREPASAPAATVRPTTGQNNDRARPALPARTHAAPAERSVQPGRFALPSDDRRRERSDAPRPQARASEARPFVAPSARSAPRPAATGPAIQVEPRRSVSRHPRAESNRQRDVKSRGNGNPERRRPGAVTATAGREAVRR